MAMKNNPISNTAIEEYKKRGYRDDVRKPNRKSKS